MGRISIASCQGVNMQIENSIERLAIDAAKYGIGSIRTEVLPVYPEAANCEFAIIAATNSVSCSGIATNHKIYAPIRKNNSSKGNKQKYSCIVGRSDKESYEYVYRTNSVQFRNCFDAMRNYLWLRAIYPIIPLFVFEVVSRAYLLDYVYPELQRTSFDVAEKPFDAAEKPFDEAEKPFDVAARSFDAAARSFDAAEQPFDAVARSFDAVAEPFDAAERSFDESAEPFDEAEGVFDAAERSSDEVGRSFDVAARSYDAAERSSDGISRSTNISLSCIEVVILNTVRKQSAMAGRKSQIFCLVRRAKSISFNNMHKGTSGRISMGWNASKSLLNADTNRSGSTYSINLSTADKSVSEISNRREATIRNNRKKLAVHYLIINTTEGSCVWAKKEPTI